jgi:glycosyltransferase involved in cell wall biosynthesis
MISVIMPNHDRREFVISALNSVLTQDFPRREYEVIVSTNSREMIHKFKEMGAETVYSSEVGIGKKVADALELSKGEIICFLDDDDLFVKSKLREVDRIFRENGVDYYHNDMALIDREGIVVADRAPWMIPLLEKMETKDKVVVMGKKEFLRKAGRHYSLAAFNSSSIAVRREVLQGRLDQLRKVEFAIDLFYFISSLDTQRPIAIDGRTLTLYRVHGGNSATPNSSSFENYLAYKLRWLTRVIEAREVMIPMIGDQFPEVRADQRLELVMQKLITKSLPLKTEVDVDFSDYLFYLAHFLIKPLNGKELPMRALFPYLPRALKMSIWYHTFLQEVRKANEVMQRKSQNGRTAWPKTNS